MYTYLKQSLRKEPNKLITIKIVLNFFSELQLFDWTILNIINEFNLHIIITVN